MPAAVLNGNQSYISGDDYDDDEDDEEPEVKVVGSRIHGTRGAWRDAPPKTCADGGVDEDKVGLEMRLRFRLWRLRLRFKPCATRGRLLIREKNDWLAARPSLTVSSSVARIQPVTRLAVSRIRLRPLGVQALTAAAARPPTAAAPSTYLAVLVAVRRHRGRWGHGWPRANARSFFACSIACHKVSLSGEASGVARGVHSR